MPISNNNFISNYLPNFAESKTLYSDNRCQILDSGDLLIGNVREADAGLYKCVRSNEAGTVTGEAFLTVLGKTFLSALSV